MYVHQHAEAESISKDDEDDDIRFDKSLQVINAYDIYLYIYLNPQLFFSLSVIHFYWVMEYYLLTNL